MKAIPNALTLGLLMVVLLSILISSGCERDQRRVSDTVVHDESDGVNAQQIIAADAQPGNWLTHGRTYDEQRFSPLEQINTENIGTLGLAWYYDFPDRRGLEATPLIVDGTMYSTGSWSKVYAHDAATGQLIWEYDPEVPRAWAVHLCCDVVNRGVAIWEDRVFVGTLDGRLIAIDLATGVASWSVQTTDNTKPYSITGAPRVVNGKVIIGNGGAEYGVRGYVSAYDAVSGQLAWRFYTVPGAPDEAFESPAMEKAAATWTGEWWRYGGGGTVWDSMAYDPDLNLIYIGVGNGSPWNHKIRSPGGGDNLYLSSIVALNADDGSYVWHYQTTPGDSWDYTATQHIVLADLAIDGKQRKVLMQAPKNGFFYVLDRRDGALISARNFVPVTWASSVDLQTGRPVEVAGARYENAPALALPGPGGAHNWHTMSYSPATGLVYIPAQSLPFIYANDDAFSYVPGFWNTGVSAAYTIFPDDPGQAAQTLSMVSGEIIAWDPVAQKAHWRIPQSESPNGGLLATAGNVLFQGNAQGEFVAYAADSGKRLWSAQTQTGVVAAPVSYTVNGEQYVAVLAGWGGSWPLVGGQMLKNAIKGNVSRILTFKLGGDVRLPPLQQTQRALQPPPQRADNQTIALGAVLYAQRCSVCHGNATVSGGVTPDLRYAGAAVHQAWDAIVRDGVLSGNGMPGFSDVLGIQESNAIQAYVVSRAHKLADAENANSDSD